VNRGRGFSTDAGAAIRTLVRRCSVTFGGPRVCPSRSSVTCSCRAPLSERGKTARRKGGRAAAAAAAAAAEYAGQRRNLALSPSLYLSPRALLESSLSFSPDRRTPPRWEQQLLLVERDAPAIPAIQRHSDRLGGEGGVSTLLYFDFLGKNCARTDSIRRI